MNDKITVPEQPNSRPRERLFVYGANSLATEELLALVLKTGGLGLSADALTKELLKKFGGLRGIANADAKSLSKFRKLGAARAAHLAACIELGRRLSSKVLDSPSLISSPEDAEEIFRPMIVDPKKEQFFEILLDTKLKVIRAVIVSVGTLNQSNAHPREVFRDAVRHSADSIIVGHNHPSGDPTPSVADKQVTQRLMDAGKVLGIHLSDHIILGRDTFVSLKRLGFIP